MDRQLRQITEKLAASEARLLYALEAAEIGVWEWDISTDNLIWDDQMLQLFSITKEEFHGNFQFFEERVHPADLALVKKRVKESIESGNNFQCVYRVKNLVGGYTVINGKGKVVHDSAGDTQKLVGICYKMSECPNFCDCPTRLAKISTVKV